LVPIQVVVLRSPTYPSSRVTLTSQLALWDRIATETDHSSATNGNGELTEDNRSLTPWVRGGEHGPGTALVAGWYIPDDIWLACNIQLRLVNFLELTVDDTVAAPNEGDLQVPIHRDWNLVQQLSGFIPNIPTELFVARCTPVGVTTPGSLTEPLGISLPGEGVACVSTYQNSSEVPAHEIGHVLLDDNDHPACTSPQNGAGLGVAANVMCAANGGAALTAAQCERARGNADANWGSFYPHPPR
jgi:hypothetical protein